MPKILIFTRGHRRLAFILPPGELINKGVFGALIGCQGVRPAQIRKGATQAVVGGSMGDQDLRA
jgi:hypothetical protein